MLKWLGAALLIGGTTGYGISLKRDMLERVRQLKYMVHMMELIKSETGYYRESLPGICSRLGGKTREPYGDFFRRIARRMEENGGESFDTVWQEESKALTRGMPLAAEEKEWWEQLSQSMGYGDWQLQEHVIRAQQEEWNKRIGQLEAEALTRGKLYTGLGAAGGLLLTIILF